MRKYFHKKGAVAAARMPDMMNPDRASSGSQFYIVQGRVFTNEELDQIEKNIQQASNDPSFKFTDEERTLYKTEGGTPFLDKLYTVFGIVVEGIETLDSIASVPTTATKPDKDVMMFMEVVKIKQKKLIEMGIEIQPDTTSDKSAK